MHRICIRHSHYISGAKKSKHVSQGMCGFLNIWTPLGKSLSNAGMTDKVRRGVEQRRRVVTTASPICHQRAHGAFFRVCFARDLQWAGPDGGFLQAQHLQPPCAGSLG